MCRFTILEEIKPPTVAATITEHPAVHCIAVISRSITTGSWLIRLEPLPGCKYKADAWEWHCGFYPGSQPGEHTSGTALTFEEARAGFERNGDYDAASSLHRSLQLRQTFRVGKRRIGGHIQRMSNQTETRVIFACPQCNLAHEVTQTRSRTKKAGGFDCADCGAAVHSWYGFFDFADWRAIRMHPMTFKTSHSRTSTQTARDLNELR
jgi:predicted RNA-binding Zn-ribbon protein involved in translation (DUF1610 family)